MTTINEKHRQKYGELEDIVKKAKSNGEIISTDSVSKKRSIAEIENDSKISMSDELNSRINYINEMLPYYGIDSKTQIPETKPHEVDEPMQSVLKVAVLEMMKSSILYNNEKKNNLDFNINKKTLDLMTEFSGQFVHLITTRLQRLMEIQRKRNPNRTDVKLLSNEGYFDVSGIHDMYDHCNKWKSDKLSNFNQWNLVENMALSAKSVFNGSDNNTTNKLNDGVDQETQFWIDDIIRRKKRKAYIPEWMPPLPPDYTYKSTPKYSVRVDNPVVLRENLVLEGKYGEQALDHIILKNHDSLYSPLSDDESISSSDGEEIENNNNNNNAIEDTKVLEQSESQVTTIENINKENEADVENTGEMNATSTSELKTDEPQDKKDDKLDEKLDIVELAKTRMKILDARRKEEEERYLSRIESEESKLGRNFGFYTNIKKLPDSINQELNDLRSKKLHHTIQNLYKQEKFNMKWLHEQEELRKKIAEEKSKYAEANEITLGLGSSNDGQVYGNLDDEVDFDIEFSDMEEIEMTDKKEKEVRFEDDIDQGNQVVYTHSTNEDNGISGNIEEVIEPQEPESVVPDQPSVEPTEAEESQILES